MTSLNINNATRANAGIRTGAEYLEGLRDDREVWLHGHRVADVTSEPGMMRGAQSIAGILDLQHDPKFQNKVTYVDDDGLRCALAFKQPQSVEDVKARGVAFYEWAKWSNGMLGRTPDYKNVSTMAYAYAADFLSSTESRQTDFAANMKAYYDYVRRNDLVLTHSLLNPTTNYSKLYEGEQSEEVALRVVDESADGIVVTGARLLATLGPLADEVEVFPASFLPPGKGNEKYSFAFSMPVNSKGIKQVCRDTNDHGKSHFDAPLASRYEEMDAVVIFDNVFVPWERVFIYNDPKLCNDALNASNAVVHMMHQVACGKLAKAEFVVGIMCAIAQANGKDKDLYTKGLIAEVMQMTEIVRALLQTAEEQAHEDQFGNFVPLRRPLDTSRNVFPRLYPRMIEILQILGSSSLMVTPAELDFSNDLAVDTEQYFQVANLDSRDRVGLFRLAHDVAVSGFGTRQVLYERFFFGPPAFLASTYYDLYDKDPLISRVNDLLSGD